MSLDLTSTTSSNTQDKTPIESPPLTEREAADSPKDRGRASPITQDGSATGLPLELAKVYDRMRTLLNSSDLSVSAMHYELGQEANALKDPKTGRMKHNDDTYGQLEKALGLAPNTLRNCAKVASQWTKAEFLELAGKERTNGRVLKWSYFVEVNVVRTAAHRRELVEKVLTENLSIHDLRQLIATNYPAKTRKRSRRSGQKGSRPKALFAKLNDWKSRIHAIKEQETNLGDELRDVLKRPDAKSPEVVAELKVLKEEMQAVVDAGIRALATLETGLTGLLSTSTPSGEALNTTNSTAASLQQSPSVS